MPYVVFTEIKLLAKILGMGELGVGCPNLWYGIIASDFWPCFPDRDGMLRGLQPVELQTEQSFSNPAATCLF